jgi:hypothetical protein
MNTPVEILKNFLQRFSLFLISYSTIEENIKKSATVGKKIFVGPTLP